MIHSVGEQLVSLSLSGVGVGRLLNYLCSKFGTKSTLIHDTGYGEKSDTSAKCLDGMPSLPSTVIGVPYSRDPLFYPL